MTQTDTKQTISTKIKSILSERLIGQDDAITKVTIALLTNSHCLLEGMPGLAKTLLIKSIAELCNLKYTRIQFTPDLLPADITGTMIYNQQKGSFEANMGPIFSNVILADEINRAPAKVQSALLEAMQEHQVSIGGQTYKLPFPFFVLATQNPIEQEGTYLLPEAQQDRFLFKIEMTYPSAAEEKEILLNLHVNHNKPLSQTLNLEEMEQARQDVKNIYIDEKIIQYVVDLIHATRNPKENGVHKLVGLLNYGASPRGSEALIKAAQAHAYIKNRQFVSPEDIKAIAHDALRHRVSPSFEAEADGITRNDIITLLLNEVQVP